MDNSDHALISDLEPVLCGLETMIMVKDLIMELPQFIFHMCQIQSTIDNFLIQPVSKFLSLDQKKFMVKTYLIQIRDIVNDYMMKQFGYDLRFITDDYLKRLKATIVSTPVTGHNIMYKSRAQKFINGKVKIPKGSLEYISPTKVETLAHLVMGISVWICDREND